MAKAKYNSLPDRSPCGRGDFISRIAHDLTHDRRGVIIVMFALLLPIIVGFIGLAVEVSLWYQQRRSIQSAADAAAIAAAYEAAEGASSTIRDATARREAQRNETTLADADISINVPPTISTVYNDTASFPNAVEVVVSKSVTPLFAGFFMNNALSIGAYAVGNVSFTQNPACVLTLGATDSDAVKVSGNGSTVTLSGCTVHANSNATGTGSGNAIRTTGNGASLTADCINARGPISGTTTTTVCSSVKTGAPSIDDPYEDIVETIPSDCVPETNYSISGNTTAIIGPGNYCGGISTGPNTTLTMTAGEYKLDEGDFSIKGNLTATNVVVIFTDSAGTNCGSLKFTSGANITISAPTSGDFSGLLYYRNSRCDSLSQGHKFTGGTNANITGAMYFPTSSIEFSGGSSVSGSCIQLIANKVDISGNAALGSNCAGTGVQNVFTTGTGSLVE